MYNEETYFTCRMFDFLLKYVSPKEILESDNRQKRDIGAHFTFQIEINENYIMLP